MGFDRQNSGLEAEILLIKFRQKFKKCISEKQNMVNLYYTSTKFFLD